MPAHYELVAVARTPQAAGPPSLVEIAPIVAPTITWQHTLDGAGYIGFSCTPERLASDVQDRFLDLVTNPTEVWLYRDSELVMASFVATYQLQNGTLSVTAPGILGYLRYMIVEADLVYSATDQHTIATGLVDQWQDLPYGDYGIDTSSVAASGVLRDRSYIAREQHNVDTRLRELGKTVDGFDISMDYATRALVLSSPSLGTDLAGDVILDARNITDASVTVSVAPGDIASDAYGLGGDGETAITEHVADTNMRAAWGRAAVQESFDGVTVQATLTDHTQALLDARLEPLLAPGPGLVPVDGADVGDFGIGDVVTYEYDGGLGVQTGAFRVAAREVSVDENGLESMAVSFA